ncbi:hypothetical protein HY629_01450, partial [Candidatus Uhrbacteria bacterium]|nr:hypothetical protein [Candidatus Uhrbacteria bacterium]
QEKDWFVYQDPKYGYVIQYPSNWESRTNITAATDWIVAGDFLTKRKDVKVPLSIIMIVGPEATKPGATLTDYATLMRENILIPLGGAGLRSVLEGMQEWPRMTGNVRVMGWGGKQEKVRGYGASFVHKKLAYTIAYVTDDKIVPNSTIKTHLRRSLLSFKFPQAPSVVKTKQYQNARFGIRLTYPEQWEKREFPSSVLLSDPKADSAMVKSVGKSMRVNASVAVNVAKKAPNVRALAEAFVKQSKQGVFGYTIVQQPKAVKFLGSDAVEIIVTYRLADIADAPLIRSRAIIAALPNRSLVIYDRSLHATYAARKAAFDAIIASVMPPKK